MSHSMGLVHFDGLVQGRCNSAASALELHISCTNPLICPIDVIVTHVKISCHLMRMTIVDKIDRVD